MQAFLNLFLKFFSSIKFIRCHIVPNEVTIKAKQTNIVFVKPQIFALLLGQDMIKERIIDFITQPFAAMGTFVFACFPYFAEHFSLARYLAAGLQGLFWFWLAGFGLRVGIMVRLTHTAFKFGLFRHIKRTEG